MTGQGKDVGIVIARVITAENAKKNSIDHQLVMHGRPRVNNQSPQGHRSNNHEEN